MINFITTWLLPFIVVLGAAVILHEFGHFIVAKLFKIRVETFSVGFGPRLFGKKVGHTDYRVSAIPLGG
jgi:regulator of sigma E protease